MLPYSVLHTALDTVDGRKQVNVLWEERVRDVGVLLVGLRTRNGIDVRRAQNSVLAAVRLLANLEKFHTRASLGGRSSGGSMRSHSRRSSGHTARATNLHGGSSWARDRPPPDHTRHSAAA